MTSADDFHRPTYHITPPANWMNDPNGAIQWQGRYHLFYQHNPYAPESRQKHWAHVVSDDLLHWEPLPLALAPEPGGYDKDGCFSGCMVVHQGVPTIIYTGVMPEVQCLATSAGDLREWRKHPGNPVLAQRPPSLKTLTFRDPYAWQGAEGWWYLLLGSGLEGEGGACLLYRSRDLQAWEYLNVLYSAPKEQFGTKWNCPNFFQLGEEHVLIIAGQPVWKPFFFTGAYRDGRFQPRVSGLVDHGGNLYASQVFFDQAGRALFWGWVWEGRSDEEIRAAGWAGVMTLPRELRLDAAGRLACAPAAETAVLRRRHTRLDARAVPPGDSPLEGLAGAALELDLRLEPGGAADCGVSVLRAADGSEQTRIGYDARKGELYVDRRQANLSSQMAFGWSNPAYHAAPVSLAEGAALELRIFIDHSLVEVYANGGLCFSSRVYRRQAGSTGVALYAEGGTAGLLGLDAWELSL